MVTFASNLLHWLDSRPTPFESLLRRDRAIVPIGVLILILLAWVHVGRLATSTEIVATSISRPWSGAEFVSMFLMWAAMMVAMMLPSATPMVLRYARIGRATDFDTNPI